MVNKNTQIASMMPRSGKRKTTNKIRSEKKDGNKNVERKMALCRIKCINSGGSVQHITTMAVVCQNT